MERNVHLWRGAKNKRGYPRLEMFAGVFIVRGEQAHLSELCNISAGGVNLKRPANWKPGSDRTFRLFFVLDQARILCIKATVAHEQDDALGFKFAPGYEAQAQQLLAESRNWR